MKLRITLLFAVLLFGITFYSCSNDDESPDEEIVAEEENPSDSDENGDDGSDEDSEGEEGDGTSDGEDTDGDSGSDGGTDDGGSDEGGSDEGGDTNDGGNGGTDDGGDGGTDDGNGDSGEGSGDSGDTPEEEESTDDVGPVINVTSPQEGQVFQQGDEVNVNTEITDDSNIAFARLFINGMLLRQENSAPYQWGTTNPNDTMLANLSPGSYELNVVAEDEFGNSSESTLSITVEAGAGDEDGDTGGGGDGGNGDEGTGNGGNGNGATSCSNPGDAEFLEENGLVVVEFENNSFPGNWDFRTNVSDFQGSGFMVWTGSQSFNNPGNGLVRFKIRIQNPGTYRFIWRSAVTIGDNGTEHNDTWLRFNDADDFFGRKSSNGNIVYPRGTGKTPNPNGSSKDGWFKIYRSGNNLGFKWQSSTSDNDGHNIFVTFNSPGVYTMEVSARSSGHAIDRFVLFDEDDYSPNQATSESNPVSEVNCN